MSKLFVFVVTIFILISCHNTRKMENTATSNNAEFKETYWKLTELRGVEVPEPKEGEKEVYFRLRNDGSRVEGNGGCNGFGGTFELSAGNRIRFSKMISTMMYCSRMETETALYKVFETADSYSLSGNVLQLNKARMAPLAKFVAVKDK
jgi:heat shock protein HslJ